MAKGTGETQGMQLPINDALLMECMLATGTFMLGGTDKVKANNAGIHRVEGKKLNSLPLSIFISLKSLTNIQEDALHGALF